ncbi:MAG: radical SAM protein [Elusimicrobiota bacterium]
MKHRVGLIQINNSFSGQNYFPYSVGILEAYARKYLINIDDFDFLPPIYKRVPLSAAVKILSGCDVCFFSVYTWNINISLAIAKRLKIDNKDTVIVFGGPQVPLRGIKEFLKKYRFIDIACHGEGEQPFLKILENIGSTDYSDVPNISYSNSKGRITLNEVGIRTTDLNEIPSPYLEGVFNRLMDENPGENWVALWETNRGCPFSCSYCVWGASTNKNIYARDIDELKREVDWFSRKKIEFIFCCDANFGILPRDIELTEYTANNKEQFGYPKALSVQNTKNSTMRVYDLYRILSDSKLNKGVSLAIQSSNPATLKQVKRENISLDAFQELQEKFSAAGIETFTDIILGLPCETYDTFADGISKLIQNGQHNRIQFNNLSILTGSEMDDPAYIRKHGIKTIENRLVNIHGNLSEKNEIEENQRLVIATKAMPKKDWVRARVFGWMTALIHFNKLAQIPLLLAAREFKLIYRDMIEALIIEDKKYPVLSSIHNSFRKKAENIQKGAEEFANSRKWLNIWWPPDELAMIELCTGKRLDLFYSEVKDILLKVMAERKSSCDNEALASSFDLNKKLIKMPFQKKNIEVELPYNIWDYYRGAVVGADASLTRGSYRYMIDRTSQSWNSWEDWCREVIWWGNKRGAYLYPCRRAG